MASSNRHWPSMFKSKPCNPHHQWQHDINSSLISSAACHRTTPYTSGCEERSPEPKPRWNPKPEQIRILEAIFNSGMVNPPRDEIRKIRAQLQEYGQVGDANVFYWFQNRKSRSKHKLRHLQNSKNNLQNQEPPQNQLAPNSSSLPQITNSSTIAAPSSSASSSSSEKSPTKELNIIPPKVFSLGFSNNNSPTASVNHQTYFQNHHLLPQVGAASATTPSETFFFPVVPNNNINNVTSSQGFCFTDQLSNVFHGDEQNVGHCTSSSASVLLSEMMMNHGGGASSKKEDKSSLKIMQQPPQSQAQLNFCFTPSTPLTTTVVPPTTSVTVPSPIISQLQGIGDPGVPARSTVFINDVAFEVAAGPLNVREAFGDDAVLIHANTGQPVLTNQWGVTLQSLHHGACYYLIW